jgi:hypothetical protein
VEKIGMEGKYCRGKCEGKRRKDRRKGELEVKRVKLMQKGQK